MTPRRAFAGVSGCAVAGALRRAFVRGAIACAVAFAAHAHEGAHDEATSREAPGLAPGYGPLAFEPPEPGTYALPPLGEAADGPVLASDGAPTRLHAALGGGVALLSFVYMSCPDVNGCPLATAVLQRVQHRLGEDPEIARRLRIVTVSFDPERDTPEVMRRYEERFARGGVEWRFVVPPSEADLAPLLEAYGQSVVPEVDETGGEIGTLAHILRVFLIDADRRIRNVYTVSFLHADTLAADVRTLLRESADEGPRAASPPRARLRPGDDRKGYDSADYESRSLGLAARRGTPADLLGRLRQPPLGLPPVPVPDDNPPTAEKVALGRKLFYDRRLSLNGTFSCAMCHVPEQGFTSHEMATAVGIEGRTVRRNAPTVYDVAYQRRLFHDGRETRLEHQVWAPLLARNEMGNPSIGAVIETLRALPDYDGLFEAAFPGRGLALETIGMAIASYERTLVSGDSPFDRWRYGGDPEALSPSARRGFALFTGRAGCAGCHAIGADSALFSDGAFHNTGIGYEAAMGRRPATSRIQVAPGRWLEVDRSVLEAVSERAPADLGRYEITQDPDDRWRYRTPGLRNVALTAPYMHDGSLATLRDVVAFYDRGGVPNETLDPRMRPLGLAPGEIEDLVAFLESLTGDVGPLVADAFAAPVGDFQ